MGEIEEEKDDFQENNFELHEIKEEDEEQMETTLKPQNILFQKSK